jgi:hypothetical protein
MISSLQPNHAARRRARSSGNTGSTECDEHATSADFCQLTDFAGADEILEAGNQKELILAEEAKNESRPRIRADRPARRIEGPHPVERE